MSVEREQMFAVFARYGKNALCTADPTNGETNELAAEEIERQMSGRLGELSCEAVLDYFYLAITHIGTIDDFKHFLPRILELMATPECRYLSAAVLPLKLREAEFPLWPVEERRAVLAYCQRASQGTALAKARNAIAKLADAVDHPAADLGRE